jgi:hypothetical protein
MNQPLETVAAIDPHRPREPILLNHYTLPSFYTKAREYAIAHQYVPISLTTVALYYVNRYGQQFIDHWRIHTGPDLYSHALFKVHGMMVRDMEEIKNPARTSDRALIPLPSVLPIKLFQSAISFQDPFSIQVVWEAYDHYRKGVDDVPDLKHMAELLYEPFAMLNHSKDKLTPAVLRNYHKLLQYGLARQTLPAQGMAIVLAEHAETELHHMALAMPDWKLPERPHLDDEHNSPIPVVAAQSPQVVDVDVPDTSDSLDDYVDHLDGSKGLSARNELQDILPPRLDFIPAGKVMYHEVTKDLKGIWLEAAELFWKTNGMLNTPDEAAREAWAIDPTIRFLQRAFTEEQFATLTKVLPIEELTDWALQFVAGSINDPPDLSWEQIRISIVSVPMARIAQLTDTPLIDFAVGVYEMVGLHDEIQLLNTTLEIMQEGLEDQARTQMKVSKDARRH